VVHIHGASLSGKRLKVECGNARHTLIQETYADSEFVY
jgi:hypothetical protein